MNYKPSRRFIFIIVFVIFPAILAANFKGLENVIAISFGRLQSAHIIEKSSTDFSWRSSAPSQWRSRPTLIKDRSYILNVELAESPTPPIKIAVEVPKSLWESVESGASIEVYATSFTPRCYLVKGTFWQQRSVEYLAISIGLVWLLFLFFWWMIKRHQTSALG